MDRPRVALTMGDVAGVGPELIASAWGRPELHDLCTPMVIGSVAALRRAVAARPEPRPLVRPIGSPEEAAASPAVIPCIEPEGAGDVSEVPPGEVDARAGRAAAEYLIHAIDLALARRIDAVTTLPLNKEAMHRGGITFPGHTEILAHRCRASSHAMMLYLPHEGVTADPGAPPGLGVVHVTLHMALRDVFREITTEAVERTIDLADRTLLPLTGGRRPRIAAAALNPHAGEGGLFGDEEIRIIRPAVENRRRVGVDVHGPFPNDTLFKEALDGKYDAVVAMYHDQGHIALKTVGFRRGVNITLGLPIVRTSVAHGTAFDIAWRGIADPSSLIEAVRAAARMVAWNKENRGA